MGELQARNFFHAYAPSCCFVLSFPRERITSNTRGIISEYILYQNGFGAKSQAPRVRTTFPPNPSLKRYTPHIESFSSNTSGAPHRSYTLQPFAFARFIASHCNK